ncbi:MAG: c-type cytochrome [Anaerolineae bacterium]|nr:c-type cytochrome [Anaerolineae bacterium]
MTREMAWMGFLATMLIVVVMGFNLLRESDKQEQAALELRIEAVKTGMDTYAENCVICHGAAGEGLGATPPLAGIALEADELYKTIDRGRYNTVMAAYGVDEGGILAPAEIDDLVTMIEVVNWGAVAVRVEELGLTPPEMVVVELTEETLVSVRALPDGAVLADGLTVYATECAACHGANGEGTTLAPALNTADLRSTMSDDEIIRLITNGVPGTLMAGWSNALTNEQIAAVTTLVRRWEDLDSAGIDLPVIEAEPIDMSPETLAHGAWLFSLTCTQCHGTDGYGTRMAPALNSQQFLADTPDAAIQQIIALGVSGTRMPAWGGRLSEYDIAALTAYLRSWEPTAPAIADVNAP